MSKKNKKNEDNALPIEPVATPEVDQTEINSSVELTEAEIAEISSRQSTQSSCALSILNSLIQSDRDIPLEEMPAKAFELYDALQEITNSRFSLELAKKHAEKSGYQVVD